MQIISLSSRFLPQVLDVSRPDALKIFNRLDINGDQELSYSEFKDILVTGGLSFSPEEFAMRTWAAKPPGLPVHKLFANLNFDASRQLMRSEFAAEFFGVYLSSGVERAYEKKSFLQRTRNRILSYPKLSKQEILNLYDQLRAQYSSVTLHSLSQCVLGSKIVSDVLCTTQQSFFPGETAFVSYNIPKEYVKELKQNPVIVCLSSEIQFFPAAGSGWQYRGKNIIDFFRICVPLEKFPKKLSGVVSFQIPEPSFHNESFDFRLFASEDGTSI